MRIECEGQSLELLPERGAFWAEASALIVADVHLGKAATFRRFGIPAPEATTDATLADLDAMLERTGARRPFVLGDLFHDVDALAPATLSRIERWRARRPHLELDLVRGNHDHRAGAAPTSLALREYDALDDPPFLLRHEPGPDDRGFVLAGHTHPAATLPGLAGRRAKCPCFHFREAERVAVLPAVGRFTGTHPIRQRAGDRVFLVGPERVIELPGAGRAGPGR